MKKLLPQILFFIMACHLSLHAQGVLDVTIDIRTALGIFEGSEVKLFRVIPWIEPNTQFSKPIKVGADGSKGRTHFRIYNQIPETPFTVPINQLEARLFVSEEEEANAKYYGSISVDFADADEMLITYDHAKAFSPQFSSNKFYDVALEIGRKEQIPETPDEEWVAHSVWNIRIYRAPVLFVHGLWSSAKSFEAMENALYDSRLYGSGANNTVSTRRNQTLRVDYEPTNDFPFVANQGVVPQALAQLLYAMSPVIAHKADVVTHSMGGVLTRLYLQNILNEYKDNINKLITCNTPHAGAQSANLLLDPNLEVRTGYQLGRDIICPLFETADFGSCFHGGVNDLQADIVDNGTSAVLNGDKLNANTVSSFTITTTEDVKDLDLFQPFETGDYTQEELLFKMLQGTGSDCASTMADAVFDGNESDLIVPQPSQQGGLSPSSTTNVISQTHDGSVANPEVISIVKDLLSKDPNALPFAKNGFNPPLISYNSPVLPCGHAPSSNNPKLKIISPKLGDKFEAGSSLEITLESNEEVYETLVIVETDGDRVLVSSKPTGDLTHIIDLDPSMIGIKNIRAVGFGLIGTPIIISESLEIQLQTGSELDSISVYPSTILTADNFYSGIQVTGHYSDGVSRDITKLTDLTYEFRHDFAEKGGGGSVNGISVGIDTMSVVYNKVSSKPQRVIVVEGLEISTTTKHNQSISKNNIAALEVFPNPANQTVNIKAEKPGILQIISMNGSVLKQQGILQSGIHSIEIDGMAPGQYIALLIGDSYAQRAKLAIF